MTPFMGPTTVAADVMDASEVLEAELTAVEPERWLDLRLLMVAETEAERGAP